MKSEWSDPTDLTPTAARTARQVHGFRAFCPLRRCVGRHGEAAGYTPEMIEAADRLRGLFDGARIGFSVLKDWRPIQAVQYRPVTGPTPTALRQLRCREGFDRIWALLDVDTRAVVGAVVLLNRPLTEFSGGQRMRHYAAKDRLITALGRMVLHFEIRELRGAAA
jgi:hypothetical protein